MYVFMHLRPQPDPGSALGSGGFAGGSRALPQARPAVPFPKWHFGARRSPDPAPEAPSGLWFSSWRWINELWRRDPGNIWAFRGQKQQLVLGKWVWAPAVPGGGCSGGFAQNWLVLLL